MSASATVYPLRKTPLFNLHRELGGTSHPWRGHEIPSHFTSILDEHEAAIETLALFDLGFRGFVRLQGPSSATLLSELATLSVADMPIGAFWEVPFVYPDGTLVDLVKVAREEEQSWFLSFRNPNWQKPLAWIREQAQGSNCWIDDLSTQYAWVALSGRRAHEYLLCGSPSLDSLRAHQFMTALVGGVASLVWRWEYNFFAVACQPELLTKVVRQWWVSDDHPQMCGWASYENWRLENGVLRYGCELKEGVNPYEIGLDKKIDLSRENFIGKSVLVEQQKQVLKHMLIYFYIDAMRMPRPQSPIYNGDRMVGVVAAGGYSLKLKRPIASAWVTVEDVDFDNLQVEIRRQRYNLNIKKPPLV